MEILFISHKYPPAIGGMEKQSFELLRHLRLQHTVRTLLYDNQESRLRFFFLLKKRIKRLLKKYPNIELIYFNDGLLAAIGATLLKNCSIPMVATVHGLDVVFPNIWYQRFLRRQFPKMTALIAVSRATAEACIKRGIPKEKIHIVHNGIDHDLAKTTVQKDFLVTFEKKHLLSLSNKKIIVTMGRSVVRKGFSWFVREVLPHLNSDAILLLIGPRSHAPQWLSALPIPFQHQLAIAFSMPSDEMALQSAMQQKAVQQKVYALGKLPFSEVRQLLSIADLFIMPNLPIAGDMEGFGLVALEAAISGTPVVAANIEGIQDAIQDGQNGWLLPTADKTVWINSINKLLADPANLKNFGRKAQSYTLNTFSWEKMAEGYNDVFKKIDYRIK